MEKEAIVAERITLYAPDGRRYKTPSATEATRLRARGYSDTPPAELRVPAAEPGAGTVVFDPAEHTVEQVQEFLRQNPEHTGAVIAAEKAGKNRASLVGA